MTFKTISGWIGEKNSNYYKNPKTIIYDDFLTYAQSPKGLLTLANAIDFHNYASKNPRKEYKILEVGVGNGAFANGFFQNIKELDLKKSTSILSKINYTLADFSKPVLQRAKELNEKFKNTVTINTLYFDASLSECELCGDFSDKMEGLRAYDLIRCNELFSDLPADLFCKINDEFFKVYMDEKMAPQLKSATEVDLQELELKLLYAMPENYFVPLNKTAANSVVFLSNHLTQNGYMDIFDYGFYSKHDFDIPADMWNLSVVREYNKQWTIDLNFIYLSSLLQSLGKKTQVQTQKDYAQKILGKKLSLSDEKGLDYKEEESEIQEDDSFYHMRVKN